MSQRQSVERTYIVAYDIADQKRWRQVFKFMKGHGTWLQLSVFPCRLTPHRRVTLSAGREERTKPSEDHVLILDLGPADRIDIAVESLGKPFQPIERKPVVI